jgi:tRNA pseudouridine32 synthase/23S rRNA pseudouridine746 synthase
MNALGVPIVGDLLYPKVVNGPAHIEENFALPLQLLARTLTFVDPVSGESRRFESQRRLDWT